MKRSRAIVVLVVVLGCIAVVVALATGALSGSKVSSSVSARAPSCLPPKSSHVSAKLRGVPVDVSPAPDSVTANPDTQISFLGVPAAQIHVVSVVGQRSGRHAGRLQGYSQGDGASFLPSAPFQAGERVTVTARIGASAAARQVSFGFRVDTPYPTADVAPYKNPPAQPSQIQSFVTMPGDQAPVLRVSKDDEDPAAGDVFTTNGPGAGPYGAYIYAPDGQLVWFDALHQGLTADDLNVQEYEGHRDLTLWEGKVLNFGFGQGEDVILNDRYQRVAAFRGANGLKPDLHEFQLRADDVSFNTAYNPIRCNLSSVEEGPRDGSIVDTAIQEVDLRTGLVMWEWHALDHVPVTQAQNAPSQTRPWDWFHLNSIDPESDGDILISSRTTWAAYQLQAGSGVILWRLGGLASSFKMGPGTKTAWQHDARMLPNGEITMYDDGANPPEHPESRAVRIKLDLADHTATLTSALTHPEPPLRAASQGNVQTLADGNVVVAWGGVPEVSEFSAAGKLLYDAHFAYDLIFYRAYRYPWSAQPASPPAVAANLNNTDEETIVHASWNGATDVSAWRVLAATSTHSELKPRATVSSEGFETETILIGPFKRVVVEALGASGQVLGRSRSAVPTSYSASLPR